MLFWLISVVGAFLAGMVFGPLVKVLLAKKE